MAPPISDRIPVGFEVVGGHGMHGDYIKRTCINGGWKRGRGCTKIWIAKVQVDTVRRRGYSDKPEAQPGKGKGRGGVGSHYGSGWRLIQGQGNPDGGGRCVAVARPCVPVAPVVHRPNLCTHELEGIEAGSRGKERGGEWGTIELKRKGCTWWPWRTSTAKNEILACTFHKAR